MDCSPLDSSVHGIFQARSWSGLPCPPPGESSQPRDRAHISCLLHWQVGSSPLVPPEKPQSFHTVSFQNIVAIMNILLPQVIGLWSTNDRKSLKWLTIWSHLSFYTWGNWGQERDKWSSWGHTQLTARVRIHSSLHSLPIVYWGPTKSQVYFGSWEYNGQKGKDLDPLAFTGLV